MAKKESSRRFIRPAANMVPDTARAKEITVKDGDVINLTLPSGTKLQLVATADNTTLKHGERETLFHEQYSEGVARCTWPPLPEEVNNLMGQLFGDEDDYQEAREDTLEKAFAGK